MPHFQAITAATWIGVDHSMHNAKMTSGNGVRPRVSIVIPNYNQARYVSDAINSVLAQTYSSYEILVVDDGSTDDSREVLAGFGVQIRYIWQENQGLAGARNTGIRAAQGEFLALLDADDIWLPDFLRTMVSIADAYPEAAVIYCCAQGMAVGGQDLPQTFGGPVVASAHLYQSILRANWIIPSTVLMRRSVIEAAGLFDQSLRSCEDWDLWLRLLPKAVFVGVPGCLVRYRLHGSSLSKNLAGMREAAAATVAKHFGAEDSCWQESSQEKRRAYGGLYRYYALTAVQYRSDWESATHYLRIALQIDPDLARDLDLFYDLVLGSQPPGYRGSVQHLELAANTQQIDSLLHALFDSDASGAIRPLWRETSGTAWYAVGIVAYLAGQTTLCRRALLRAFYFKPELLHDYRASSYLLKSLVGPAAVARAKKYRASIRGAIGAN